jgi:hypothetical protein
MATIGLPSLSALGFFYALQCSLSYWRREARFLQAERQKSGRCVRRLNSAVPVGLSSVLPTGLPDVPFIATEETRLGAVRSPVTGHLVLPTDVAQAVRQPHPTRVEDYRIRPPGCQKAIAQKIIDRGGDYVLTVKDNQEHLLADIQQSFADAAEKDFAGCLVRPRVTQIIKKLPQNWPIGLLNRSS